MFVLATVLVQHTIHVLVLLNIVEATVKYITAVALPQQIQACAQEKVLAQHMIHVPAMQTIKVPIVRKLPAAGY